MCPQNSQDENENFRIGRDVALKFDFYFIALIFTVLGLTVQTASFENQWGQYIFEILAWVSLTASGLAPLTRLEWLPVAYKHRGYFQTEQGYLEAFKKGLEGVPIVKSESGEEWQPEELINAKKKLETHLGKRKMLMEGIEERCTVKYRIQKMGFMLGIICLIISRGILHYPKFIKGESLLSSSKSAEIIPGAKGTRNAE